MLKYFSYESNSTQHELNNIWNGLQITIISSVPLSDLADGDTNFPQIAYIYFLAGFYFYNIAISQISH